MTTSLSFGGGRQTVGLVALIAQGEWPKPDFVLFADTGWEWPETYDYMERYVKPCLIALNIPFVRVHASYKAGDNLWDYYIHYRAIPMPMDRTCTKMFKTQPLAKFYRSQVITEEWIGFSYDEQGRTKAKRPLLKRLIVRYPLIELNLTVHDCVAAIERQGWPIPLKSSCVFCSFQHPWRAQELYKRHPDLFEQVGLLEDNALKRSPGWYILGNKPWRQWGIVQSNLWGEDWNYGCAEGYCFR